FFFSSRRRHTRFSRDWSSDVCSSDLPAGSDPRATPSNNDSPGETPDSPPAPCPDGRAPTPGDLVLNEFLVNVPAGPAGDANNDEIGRASRRETVVLSGRGHLLDPEAV